MALKFIKLHVTRQEADAAGRRKTVRVKVADTNVSDTGGGKGTRNVPLLLTHALSVGGSNVAERIGFDYLFSKAVNDDPHGGGFTLGVDKGFPYVFDDSFILE